MGLAQGIESAAFACIVFVAGTLGTIALAAHQITMSVVTLVYMTAVGMAGATAIRVGHAVGAGSRPDILRAGTVGIALGALISLPVGIAIALAPDRIAGIYTDEPAVLAITRHTFLVAGILLAFDAAMGVVTGALRGAGDVWVPTLAQTAAFWMVGLPVAIWLATSGGLGPVGLMAGIVIGTLASLGILLPRFGLVVNRPIKPI
jgi:MATE family multidrug resistance protein